MFFLGVSLMIILRGISDVFFHKGQRYLILNAGNYLVFRFSEEENFEPNTSEQK